MGSQGDVCHCDQACICSNSNAETIALLSQKLWSNAFAESGARQEGLHQLNVFPLAHRLLLPAVIELRQSSIDQVLG